MALTFLYILLPSSLLCTGTGFSIRSSSLGKSSSSDPLDPAMYGGASTDRLPMIGKRKKKISAVQNFTKIFIFDIYGFTRHVLLTSFYFGCRMFHISFVTSYNSRYHARLKVTTRIASSFAFFTAHT